MATIKKLTFENKDTFFLNEKVKRNYVFEVDSDLLEVVEDIAYKNGFYIDTFDKSKNGKFHGIRSLYPTIPSEGDERFNFKYIESLTEEKLASEIIRIENESGLKVDSLCIYDNLSDNPFFNGKEFKVLEIIPDKNMINLKSDCVNIELKDYCKRKDLPNWKNKDLEYYEKFNKKHNKNISPDDVVTKNLTVPISYVKTLNQNQIEFNNKLEAIRKIVVEGKEELVNGDFANWVKKNLHFFVKNI